MSVQSRATIKSWFETDDYPTQAQFAEWIDSFYHKNEDTVGRTVTADEIRDKLQTLVGANRLQAIAILTDSLNRLVTDDQMTLWNSKANPSQISDAVTALKDNVPAGGETLKKLYDSIQTLNSIVTSNDVNLDTVQEIVSYIKSEQSLIDTLSTNKVNKSDVVDNLLSTDAQRPLSANQGKVLKALIDALVLAIPATETQASILNKIGTGGITETYLSQDVIDKINAAL